LLYLLYYKTFKNPSFLGKQLNKDEIASPALVGTGLFHSSQFYFNRFPLSRGRKVGPIILVSIILVQIKI